MSVSAFFKQAPVIALNVDTDAPLQRQRPANMSSYAAQQSPSGQSIVGSAQALVRNWRFPSSRRYLWDKTASGPTEHVHPRVSAHHARCPCMSDDPCTFSPHSSMRLPGPCMCSQSQLIFLATLPCRNSHTLFSTHYACFQVFLPALEIDPGIVAAAQAALKRRPGRAEMDLVVSTNQPAGGSSGSAPEAGGLRLRILTAPADASTGEAGTSGTSRGS